MELLHDKVAIVTGASSGIGRAAALLFARHGAKLVLNARNSVALEETENAIRSAGGTACAVIGDVGEEATHREMVTAAVGRFGGLHVAFNNAGTVGAAKPIAEVLLEEWEAVMRTNLTAAFLGARHQIPAMLDCGGGSIIFTSSFVGTSVGLQGMASYGCSKAALMGLVKGIVADYATQGIRANALLSGGADTPLAGDAGQKIWAAGLHAVRRIAQPEEIAQAALFLASDMSSFVTGSPLIADGGNSAVK